MTVRKPSLEHEPSRETSMEASQASWTAVSESGIELLL